MADPTYDAQTQAAAGVHAVVNAAVGLVRGQVDTLLAVCNSLDDQVALLTAQNAELQAKVAELEAASVPDDVG